MLCGEAGNQIMVNAQTISRLQIDNAVVWSSLGLEVVIISFFLMPGCNLQRDSLKLLFKLIRILHITFCYKQLCGKCLVHMTPVVKVVIHCVFALL